MSSDNKGSSPGLFSSFLPGRNIVPVHKSWAYRYSSTVEDIRDVAVVQNNDPNVPNVQSRKKKEGADTVDNVTA